MREFLKAMFSMLMFIFLLVGCVHNIFHLQMMDDNRMKGYPNYQRRYSPYRTSTYVNEQTTNDNEDQALNNEEETDVQVSYDY